MANKSIKEESYFKNFQKYLKEDALNSKEPIGLSKLDTGIAKAAATTGTNDNNPNDDKSPSNTYNGAADGLKPSQKQIILIKAFNMAMNTTLVGGKFPPGGDLAAIISADNYIMDGHHRWAATMLLDKGINVAGTQIMLPAKDLITALNIYTKGALNIQQGNPGEGDIAQFTGDNIQKTIIEVAEKSGKSPDSPDGKAPGYAWDDLKARITKLGGGDYNKGLSTLKSNADYTATNKKVETWMPDRSDMPVIDAAKVKEVADAAAAGQIDIKQPFSPETSKELGKEPAAESIIKNLQKQMINLKENHKREKAILIGESALKKSKKKK